MEIVDIKKLYRIAKIIGFVTAIFIIFSFTFYIYNFSDHTISSDPANWGTFGDYVGGFIGMFLNIIASFFSLLGIYLTYQIAVSIQKYEIKRDAESVLREKEKLGIEMEVAHKQNIPLPFIDMTRFTEKTEIKVCNYGIGPLIITDWHLLHDGKQYKNFNYLIGALLKKKYDLKEIKYFNNSSPNHILSAGFERILFSIEEKKYQSSDFFDYQYECRDFIKDTEIRIHYEDIFGNKKVLEQKLDFLKN